MNECMEANQTRDAKLLFILDIYLLEYEVMIFK